jgi:hypothetical protein
MTRLNARPAFIVLALVIAGCQTTARQELKKIAADLQQKAEDVRQDTAPGIYTLEISGGQSEVALLPAHGTAASFGLPAALTHDLDQRAAAENGHLFLIRDQHIVAEERLDPMLVVAPAYTRSRETQFKMVRAKQSPQQVEMSLLNPPQ